MKLGHRTRILLFVLGFVTGLASGEASAQNGKVQIQWLGQSVFKITTPSGKVLLTDPWLIANPKTPPEFKNLDALGKIDLILVSHAHYDHFADAPALARKHNIPIYAPAGLNQALLTLGVLPAALVPRANKGGTARPFSDADIKVTFTHAEHSSELTWRDPKKNNGDMLIGHLPSDKDETLPGGEPVGFLIELENGFKIYHAGDTGLFGDMKLIGEYYKPDLVMLPIGGNFTMDPKDAAYATREFLKPKYAIPMHYGAHPLGRGTPQEFTQALGDGGAKVFPMNPGDKIEF
jgi:L-ascorbate metabolism protein UlaG (beta-lactamase superfamily)